MTEKIVIDLPRLAEQPLGMQTYIECVLSALLEAAPPDWDICVQTFAFRGRRVHHGRIRRIDPSRRARLTTYPLPVTLYDRFGKISPLSWLRFRKARLVHSLGGRYLGSPKAPLIVTLQDIIPLRTNEHSQDEIAHMRKAFLTTTRAATSIITISNFSKSEMVQFLDLTPDKIEVIPNGVDMEYFRPLPEEDRATAVNVLQEAGVKGPYILHMGGSSPRKNVKTLVDAYQILRDSYASRLRLVLCGSARPHQPVVEAINRNRYKDDIIVLGYLDNSTRLKLLQQANVLAFPSTYEGFGLPPLEAMACGVPVVLANAASLPEVGGDAALYFDANNAEQLAEQLNRLDTEGELRQECRSRGLKRASTFTWRRNAELTIAAYQKFLE